MIADSAPKPARPTAVIKLGSTTSVVLVAARLAEPQWREYRTLNLLTPSGASQLPELLKRWDKQLTQMGALTPLVAGGEAFRRHPELVPIVTNHFSRWWNLTGVQEGRLAWIGVKAADPAADVVVDIGGGSTEMVTATQTYSMPIGAARPNAQVVWPALPRGRPVLVGGTAVVLSRVFGADTVDSDSIRDLGRHAASPAWRALVAREAGSPQRADLFWGGLQCLLQLLAVQAWTAVTISPRGLLEGLWLIASLGRRTGQR
jgi:exopolyphosphatase/pppGpp-phosphohydrolase